MPTYQYACPDCGHRFELKQKFTDNPVKKCPNCQKFHVYRVVGQVAVTFKGSGWYITDSKSSAEKHTLGHKPKDATSGDKSDTATATAEKTETKSDSKSESRADNKGTEAASRPAADKSTAEKSAEKSKKD